MGWELPQRLLAIAWRAAVMGLLLGGLLAGPAEAAPSFDARGSVEQVYATGLEPGRRDEAGRRDRARSSRRKRANAEGGRALPAREAGQGLPRQAGRRRRGLAEADACSPTARRPLTPSVYDQEIPADGYGYLTTRDGTKLAINVHPPSDVKDVIPDLPIPDLPPATPPRR